MVQIQVKFNIDTISGNFSTLFDSPHSITASKPNSCNKSGGASLTDVETSHTWHHSDEQLLVIIRRGTAALVGGGYQSDMPGFVGLLTDTESQAVLDYIKSSWPKREADYQRQISGG